MIRPRSAAWKTRLLLAGAFAAGSWCDAAHADPARPRAVADALEELRIEDAEKLLLSAGAHAPTEWSAPRALLHFYKGEYEQALHALDQVGPRASTGQRLDVLRPLIESTAEATRGFKSVRSHDGRFVVLHAPGPDGVLVPYAMDALRMVDRAISAKLGYRHPGPIRLEIYATASALAKVSTLTEAEIERTGTIAICKWDRLMITSPRALVRGYPWLDTIAHEYVHLVLSRITHDRAPVWVQEGIAKFLERAWRAGTDAADATTHDFDPGSQTLLERAVKADKLLPFERLHPSIARLPTQDDAALAFAQVSSFIRSYDKRYGTAALVGAVSSIRAGTDARKAFAQTAHADWATIESACRNELLTATKSTVRVSRRLKRRFKRATKHDDAQEVEAETARRHLRLGDMLWNRGRPNAAVAEYARGRDAAQDDPIVAARFARASVSVGRTDDAIRAIQSVLSRYPDYAPGHVILGAAFAKAGKAMDAGRSLREAIRINPFDPEPHCTLTKVAESDRERRQESEMCQNLSGLAP
jgi:tetratricopeptide (TPR) repeat protein